MFLIFPVHGDFLDLMEKPILSGERSARNAQERACGQLRVDKRESYN
jgi:hypothetical protein